MNWFDPSPGRPSGAYGYLMDAQVMTRKRCEYAELHAVRPSIHSASLFDWQAVEFDRVTAKLLAGRRRIEASLGGPPVGALIAAVEIESNRDDCDNLIEAVRRARSSFEPSTYTTD